MGAAAKRFRSSPESTARFPRLLSSPGQPPREHRILRERALIGNSDEADFVLKEPTVSHRHALIIKRDATYVLSDLGSLNGTFVNGTRLVPRTEHALSSADDIQIGSMHFTFLSPETAHEMHRKPRRRKYVAGLIIAIVLLAMGAAYLLRQPSRNKLPVPSMPPPAAVVSDTWLSRLNHYRQSAGLTPVSEAEGLSTGDANHARYLVANKNAMIRSGRIDASIHDEDPGQPYFTPEGKTAGALSDVDTVFADPPEIPDSPWAIENWMTGPFHRMWLLNPALHEVGYGQFCENGICAAALNIRSGVRATASTPVVMYPPDRVAIRNGTFSADEVEWPDPLATCGYHTPTGIPITLQIGSSGPAKLDAFSLSRDGTAVESCGFDASSYRSSDPVAVERVKKQLAHFAAIVMVPKQPLVRGATYDVKIIASGKTFSWQFTVAPQ